MLTVKNVNLAQGGMQAVILIRLFLVGLIVVTVLFSCWAEFHIIDTNRRTVAATDSTRELALRKRLLEESLAKLPAVSEESRATLRYLASLDLGHGREGIDMLQRIEGMLPDHIALTRYAHDRWGGVVRLSGVAERAQDVAILMFRLEHAKEFESVKLERQETASESPGRVLTTFEITCHEPMKRDS